MKKKIIAFIMAPVLAFSAASCGNIENGESKVSTESVVSDSSNQQSAQAENKTTAFEYWTDDSPAMKSIMAFVSEPTYVDQCLMIHRLAHDDTYKGNEEDTAYCKALEEYLLNGGEKPKAPRSSGDIIADAFKGFTVEEYREYVRKFMSEPVAGFENMTYADGYYKPMVSLIKYLTENGFKVYINSGAEVNMLRELSSDVLGEYIPSYQVIGTRFGITAENRSDDVKARDYTPSADEKIIFDGTVKFKNLKLNKVVSIINDIGISPLLAFGNSSGDLAMGQYVMQHGGKAFMLLCDDTDRDHGDTEVAASFKEDCDKMGIETVSMKNEFATIYGDFKLTAYSDTAESLAPAA